MSNLNTESFIGSTLLLWHVAGLGLIMWISSVPVIYDQVFPTTLL